MHDTCIRTYIRDRELHTRAAERTIKRARDTETDSTHTTTERRVFEIQFARYRDENRTVFLEIIRPDDIVINTNTLLL